jgi:hypothetical protein
MTFLAPPLLGFLVSLLLLLLIRPYIINILTKFVFFHLQAIKLQMMLECVFQLIPSTDLVLLSSLDHTSIQFYSATQLDPIVSQQTAS